MADEAHREYEAVEELEAKFKTFNETQAKILADIETYKKSLASIHAQQDKLMEAKRNQEKEMSKLKQQLSEMEKQQTITRHQRDLYSSKLSEASKSLQAVNQLMPKTGSAFLWLLLGRVNVVIDKYGDRHFYKEQYEHFKKRITIFVIPVSMILIALPFRWLDFIFNAFLTYYYLTLMIREHILKVNGSNIQRWWTIHHFLSMLLAAMMLTWPASAAYYQFRPYMCYFTLYLAVVQLLQIQYQIGRLYTLRAMGRAGLVDVADSDTGYVLWSPSLLVLMPFLLAAQAAQLYLALTLFKLSRAGAEWQTAAIGALFTVLGVGNLFVTIRTCARKVMENLNKKTA